MGACAHLLRGGRARLKSWARGQLTLIRVALLLFLRYGRWLCVLLTCFISDVLPCILILTFPLCFLDAVAVWLIWSCTLLLYPIPSDDCTIAFYPKYSAWGCVLSAVGVLNFHNHNGARLRIFGSYILGHKQIIVCSYDMLGRGSIPVEISVPITSLLLVGTTISANLLQKWLDTLFIIKRSPVVKHFGGASPKLTMVKFPYFNQIFKLMVEWEIFHWDTKMNIQLTGHKNEHTIDGTQKWTYNWRDTKMNIQWTE
jgi:hypothetical protein